MDTLIDLQTYPLDRPDSPDWHALVTRCRRDLAAEGLFNLDGFLKRAALTRAVAQLWPVLQSRAFLHARRHNIYFAKSVPGLAPDHPALRDFETSNRTICTDQMADTIVRQIYEWPPFAAFLAAVMDRPALFVMDDPLAGVNTMAYADGQALNWHFDRSEFTTTLLLQAPKSGGDFEYRTGLRSEDDPNYDGVARMLAGDDPDVRLLHLEPGTLNVFRGRNTAHRVTPVSGPDARIISVFSFYDRPGVSFTRQERIGFYGRAE